MAILERYNAEPGRMSARQREMALRAIEKGDEREYTIHLTQASMLGDMLKTFGKIKHKGARPGYIENVWDSLKKEEEKQHRADDYDMADRAHIKAMTICQVIAVLERLEKGRCITLCRCSNCLPTICV